MEAELKMWGDVHEMQIIRGGGLSGDPEALKRLRSTMSQVLDDTFRRGRDVVTIGKNKNTAIHIGGQYIQKHGLKATQIPVVGSRIVVRSNGMMRAAGLEPNETPQDVRDKFVEAAALYEEVQSGQAIQEDYEAAVDKARAAAKAGG